jgi:transposase-like protein
VRVTLPEFFGERDACQQEDHAQDQGSYPPQVRGRPQSRSDRRRHRCVQGGGHHSQASSPALARLAREEFLKTWGRELPSATACFDDNFEACIAHLRLPIGHRRAIRTTNLLERMFGEERRRTKVIAHAFGERAVMKLMYAALMRARQGWRNVIITPFEVKQIQTLRDHLRDQFEQRHASPLKSASRSRIHSTQGT